MDNEELIKVIKDLIANYPTANLKLRQVFSLERAKELLTKHEPVENAGLNEQE